MNKNNGTSFHIKDWKEFEKIKYIAGINGFKLQDFLWQAAIDFTKKQKSIGKPTGLDLWTSGEHKVDVPVDLFDYEGWDRYIMKCDLESFEKLREFKERLRKSLDRRWKKIK